jgi:nitrite reductase/ring-hydroxylating ferredoxin subunit
MSASFTTLVESGSVDRRVYDDPELFAAEMERIFGRAWLYVAHESQLAAPGDFVEAFMGARSVIAARHADGSIRVFLNRCTHRGMKVCSSRRGSRSRFVCPYHGWTFATDGALVSVPPRKGGNGRIAPGDPALALAPAPQIGVHRGFVFACWSEDAPALSDWLGPAADAIGAMLALSPAGEAVPEGLALRSRVAGNWKLHAADPAPLAARVAERLARRADGETTAALASLAGGRSAARAVFLWPNLLVLPACRQVHLFQPAAADVTVVHSTAFALAGATDAVNRHAAQSLAPPLGDEAPPPAGPDAAPRFWRSWTDMMQDGAGRLPERPAAWL